MAGDVVTANVKAIGKDEKSKVIVFEATCLKQDGKVIIKGEPAVVAATEKTSWDFSPLLRGA